MLKQTLTKTLIIGFFTFSVVFAQTGWERFPGNPVLSGGVVGDWDESGVIAARTLFDGTTYHMWYSSLDSLTGIGYATSPDGFTWTKHDSNPVLEPGPAGAWDDTSPGAPSVVFNDSTYHMWYQVFDGTNLYIGYASSPDGFTWTKHDSNPVLEPGPAGAWDDKGVFSAEVIYKDGNYHTWYTGWDGLNTRIGLATSSDGINWTKSASNPVMDMGSDGSWDDAGVGYASIVFNYSTYHMWYTGDDSTQVGLPWGARTPGIGYATSPDGITWTRHVDNPVFQPGPWGDWDEWLVFLADVIYVGAKYQMWYTGFGSSLEFHIGYAESETNSPVITSVSDVPEDQGGWVYLNWMASSLDSVGEITQYGVWELSLEEGWVSLGNVPSIQAEEYTYLAHTFGDSTAEGIFWSQFMVTAHTTDPVVYYTSAVDSGYSIDNLAPAVPTGLLAAVTEEHTVELSWDSSVDEDFQYFKIYRNLEPDFDPTGLEPFAETIDITFIDSDVEIGDTLYYRISAVDFNGNESEYSEAVEAPVVLSLDDLSGIPMEFGLHQNYPNPFNPVTTLRYDLPERAEVTLTIYDILGRQVVTLVEDVQEPGFKSVLWNGRNNLGEHISAGVYLYQIRAGDFVQTRKMVLLK